MILLAVFLFFFSPPWGLAWYPRARNSLSFLEDASAPELVGVGWGKKILCLYACVFSRFSHVRLFATPWTVACQSPLSMGFSSKNTEVGWHFLLQVIFLTQGSNPGLLHCRQILYRLGHQGRLVSLLDPLNVSLNSPFDLDSSETQKAMCHLLWVSDLNLTPVWRLKVLFASLSNSL